MTTQVATTIDPVSESPKKQNKAIEKLNKNPKASLPPGVEGLAYGSLFVEVGQMEWFTYDGINYLADSGGENHPIFNLFANFKFWGEASKGIYLRCQNGMRKGEKITNKFRYEVRAPERTLEKYLDDMGVLVVDFFDTERNQTVGTSKIMIKLYIKRAKREDDEQPLLELRGSFPITLTGNQNVKIGQFQLTMVTSFPLAHHNMPRPDEGLMDSFIANEKKASELADRERNQLIHDKIFQDTRVPTSLQGTRQNEEYKSTRFALGEVDERPTREKPRGKENQRAVINIDESEDTFHNQDELAKILARGNKLRQQMDQALNQDLAWEALHGPHAVPKKYVPPFQQKSKEDDSDRIYEIEVEGVDSKVQEQAAAEAEAAMISRPPENQAGHLSEMKFIKVKVVNLRVDNEELLHELIDHTFTMTLDVPLPDIYQKKIAFQSLKLNNYDVVSFNEFSFNSSTLYNFKVDEETLSKLIASNLKVQLESVSVHGSMPMVKLLMAKGYKLEVTIPMERTVKAEDQTHQIQKKAVADKKASKGGKNSGKNSQQPTTPIAKGLVTAQQTYTHQVGSMTLELCLQRGETDVEIAREYQIKLQKLEEAKAKEDQLKLAEMQKYQRYTQQEGPTFGSLYINICQIRNLTLGSDGSLQPVSQLVNKDESLSERPDAISSVDGPRRNLFVQYKAFPGLEKLRTNIVWQEKDPKFQYRSQFPIIMNTDSMEKLKNFTFILEVWDHITPGREEFIGLVKIPLASFCYSMKTSDEQVFSLNFLADQHCLYPMIVSDGYLPIYSPRLGQSVGELAVTVALGSSIQINRQIQKEQDQERQRIELEMKTKIAEAMHRGQKSALNEFNFASSNQQLPPVQEGSESPRQSQPKERNTGANENPLEQFFHRQLNQRDLEESPEKKQDDMFKSLGNFFRQSINSVTRDVDYRKLSYLQCIRKLFEEARQSDFKELSGQCEMFKEMPKNYDGTLKVNDFIYAILNAKCFTLTRTEISNIVALIAVPQGQAKSPKASASDQSIDLEDLNRSYRAYITYYDSIEQKIADLLEKFNIQATRKIQDIQEFEAFVQSIEAKASESKIPIRDLKDVFDTNGIYIKDVLFDQLSTYFDLDRNDQIYITSFCEYLRTPSMKNFNFLKVHPVILVNLVGQYIQNEVQVKPHALGDLEYELKISLYPRRPSDLEPSDFGIPADFLVHERINAVLFQKQLRKQGVNLTLWEVLTLYDHLNTSYEPRNFLEPQRYHYLQFPHFYKFITGSDYEARLREEAIRREQKAKEEEMKRLFEEETQRMLQDHQQKMAEQQNPLLKASLDSAFDLAADLNPGKKKQKKDSDGIYSSKSYDEISEKPEESEDVVIKKEKRKNRRRDSSSGDERRKRRNKRKEMTFADKVREDSSENESVPKAEEDNRPYKKVKHIFEIQVRELKNIPILDKLVKDLSGLEIAKLSKHSPIRKETRTKYIQNVAVKYSFPLDEDEVFQSDFLQLNNDVLQELNQYDYKVSINTVHNYMMSKDDPIQRLLKASNGSAEGSLFNISVVIYDGSKEFVIGNAQLPIEDLVDVVDNYHAQILNGAFPTQKQTMSRILFIYGTTFSQRENCIIGKMQVEINYSLEKLIEEQAISATDDVPSCFLHRETFIKRKIPLNAVLSVEVERINNLKESLENIEHFAKIQLGASKPSDSVNKPLSALSKNQQLLQTKDQTDRRRILTQIFKQGLNIVVLGSVFEEDGELKKRFPAGKYTSKLLFNTLAPIFNEGFDVGIQMDTSIFDYLKTKKAIFEVRHYIIEPGKAHHVSLSNHKSHSSVSQVSHNTEEQEEIDLMKDSDYIVLGYVRVPLLHLITKNNGIDGDFVIFDDYKQQMGTLKLRIGLNHHSTRRPLYSETSRAPEVRASTMIDKTVRLTQSLMRGSRIGDEQYLLGLNFQELVFKDRQASMFTGGCFMYLKFQVMGQKFQTKFISSMSHANQSHWMKKLNIQVFDIKKTVFVELDFLRQTEIESVFSKPLEVELWLKKESETRYQRPELETQIGSFFIELNDLGKLKNRRLKDSNGLVQGYEGYFSLFDFQRQQVAPDRLGFKLLLVKKEYETQLPDLEILFNNLGPLDKAISTTLDPAGKGFAELDDLISEVNANYDGTLKDVLINYLATLEYKNSEKVYYSPLAGPIAPFFRYAKRFDNFEVVDKFNKELQSIDTIGTGFVPINLFRSILEHELKIKEKIVLDFIGNLRETDQSQQLQSLDVNLFTNSLRSHIDYVVLLRKLGLYFEIRQDRGDTESQTQFVPHTASQGESVVLQISIESAMRLRSPQNELESPNSYVTLQLPYSSCSPQQISTPIIQRSSYPAWHTRNQQVTFPLTQETLRHIIDYPLQFEVYHQQAGMRDYLSNQLIGVAFVDLSQMVFVDGAYQVSGYFHIVRKERFQDAQHVAFANPHRMSSESLGQIKLTVISNTNLKRTVNANPLTRSLARENSPLSKIRVQSHLDQELCEEIAPSMTQQRLEHSFNQMSLQLQEQPESDARTSLAEKMSELDQLQRSLLQRARNSSQSPPPSIERQQFQDFRLTRGHGQSQELRQSFQAFAHHTRHNQQQNAPTLAHHEQVIEEEREESFRRDNIFENNISQSSNYRQSEDEAEKILRLQEEEAKALNEILNPDAGRQPTYYDTFNQKSSMQNLPGQPQPSVTNVFAENIMLGRNRLSVTEDDEEITPGAGLGTSVPHRGIVSSQDEDDVRAADDDFDEREIRRVEKILRQKKE